MKLVPFCSLLLAGSSVVCGASNIAVYELSADPIGSVDSAQLVSMKSAVLYLADKFGLGEFYKLGRKADAIEFIDSMHKDQLSKPSLLVIMKGVDSPSTLVKERTPSFEIAMNKHKSAKHLMKTLFKRFPRQYAKSVNASHVSLLTNEIKYVSGSESDQMIHDFKHFHHELPQKWSSVIDTFSSKQNVIAEMESSLQLINDKLYISELMQLLKFSGEQERESRDDKEDSVSSTFVVANLDSLFSLGSKLGYDAKTYKVAKSALVNSIEALQSLYDVTIVAVGPEHKHACDKSEMSKRSKELSEMFSDFSKRESSSYSSCFSDESECQTATNNCNLHGVCTRVRSKCWQCLCSPSYDKKTSKTTKWTGFDCNKKDIAAQTQLLLWTSIALLITLVGGIKLLFNIGSDSLPGVLEAATLKKAA